MKLNTNDILVCHTPCYMTDSNEQATTVGKKYTIINIDNKHVTIKDDLNHRHNFTIRKDYKSENFKTWFITLKESRKLKFQKINKYDTN